MHDLIGIEKSKICRYKYVMAFSKEKEKRGSK